MQTNKSDLVTPRSMYMAKVWSTEGKEKRPKTNHWSFKPAKLRYAEPTKWISKKEQYAKAVYSNSIK